MQKKEKVLENTIRRCREKNIIIPTFEEMRNPEIIPPGIKEELKGLGLWDLDPRNLFRITWKNEPKARGGGFNGVNFLCIPPSLSNVEANIYVLSGKYFPTGSHKVGATFGPLVSRLVEGSFDPTTQKAVWPSTGNYCRGGAYDGYLLGCPSIAILPEGMSEERFKWLKDIGAEVFATPGSESNVKEIYDKCHQLKAERKDEVVILNQFDEFSNAAWHYYITGSAMEELFLSNKKEGERLAGIFLTQGSAGTLSSADFIKEKYPLAKLGAGEALQCPTLLLNGYGDHRIEGIGDKHIPWVHNIKSTDMVAGIDDEACICLARLFNEPAGKEFLSREAGVPPETVKELNLLGISAIANILGCIKMARYYEMNRQDVLLTVATDSMELYGSRLSELRKSRGEYTSRQAAVDYHRYLEGAGPDHMLELSYYHKKRMHNLKYFTWVEQQGKDVKELDDQWYDRDYFKSRLNIHRELDEKIKEFNRQVGLIQKYQ